MIRQTKDGNEITERFYYMLGRLVEVGILPHKKFFAEMHNLDSGNFFRKNRQIRVEWLKYIEALGANSKYVLNGEGDEFNPGIVVDGVVTHKAYHKIWSKNYGTNSGTTGTK